MRFWSGMMLAVLVGGVLSAPLRAEAIRPAELPPPDYAGQQYVDSKGCLFMRAGTPGQTLWLPRVTRQGVPLCGNPPSGRRVSVEESGAAAATGQPTEAAPATGAFFVAVGSFGVAENVDRALARLRALDYPATSGTARGANSQLVTVFAGPFGTAEAAGRASLALRGAGFPDAVVVGR